LDPTKLYRLLDPEWIVMDGTEFDSFEDSGDSVFEVLYDSTLFISVLIFATTVTIFLCCKLTGCLYGKRKINAFLQEKEEASTTPRSTFMKDG